MLRKSFLLFFVTAVLLSIAACSTTVPEEPVLETPEPTSLPDATETKIVSPTPTPVTIIETIEPTSTIAPTETATPPPVATIEPEIPPIDFALAHDLDGYVELQSAILQQQDGKRYLAYAVRDGEIDTNDPNFRSSSEVCRVAFFKWQDDQLDYIGSFPAPVYPGSTNEASPYWCVLIDWEQSNWRDPYLSYAPFWPTIQSENSEEILNLQSAGSDINNNGLPEFAVEYQYCNNACWNWGIVATHFYEIQPDGAVVNITADLPGAVVPFFNLVHDNHPGTLYLYDWGYVGPDSVVDSWWIYSWQDGKYVDTTPQYADDILAWGDDWLAEIQLKYGTSLEWLPPYEFSQILFQYEKAGLQDEAVRIFSAIAEFDNWPGSDVYNLCYLRIIEDQALLALQNAQPFSLPPNVVGFGSAGLPPECKDLEATQ